MYQAIKIKLTITVHIDDQILPVVALTKRSSIHRSLTHNASPRAEEASGAEGGRALGVPGQTLRAEEAWGAHHYAQHGLLAGGLITAVVALQAR